MRILIDAALARAQPQLVEALARAGHEVEQRGVARAAGAELRGFEGIAVASAEAAEQVMRGAPGAAVIVFTRLGDVEERVRALEAGAADAVDAGFPMSQTIARVGAAGRRAALVPRPAERIELDGCTIDLSACTCTREGQVRALTPREVELVRYLARHAGRVVSRGELLEQVWRVSPRSETRSIDVAISELRAKLERVASEPKIVVSLKGAGYRWG
jgi:DNA-binding response OmpR family regulator